DFCSITAPAAKNPAKNPGEESNKYEIIEPLKSVTKHGKLDGSFSHRYLIQKFHFAVGESALLQCKMSPGTVNVQWLKDNKAIAGSNCKTYKKDDTYYMEVTNLSTDDNGLYTVVASNLKKSISSSSTLNVLSGINTELYRQFESCHRLILFTV